MEINKNKIIAIFCLAFLQINICKAQEIKAKVVINASAINNVDPGVFKTLQQSLTDFINQRKWTSETYEEAEKIDCNLQITVVRKKVGIDNSYECKLTVQAGRSVYGTDYTSPIINIQDAEADIKYVQFQPIDFNENRISGSDPLVSNLSAIIAYYMYMVIGLHQDSYKLNAGTQYFTKAQNIVSNAPEGSGIGNGWKADGKNNRFWKIDNLLNTRFSGFRQEFYNYHRLGLDQMKDTPKQGIEAIQNVLNSLSLISIENPNTALFSLYFTTKSDEYLQMIPQFSATTREQAVNQISNMDITNAIKYRALLKQ